MDINNTDLINTLDFVDQNERRHFAQAQLGEQVREFLCSPAGRYLHGRAKMELQEVKDKALECNPYSFFGRRKLKKIQHQAGIARAFMTWCSDAITDGEFSYRELEENYNHQRG